MTDEQRAEALRLAKAARPENSRFLEYIDIEEAEKDGSMLTAPC